MSLTDVSHILHDGMRAGLETWNAKLGGADEPLYWLLVLKSAQIAGNELEVIESLPAAVREEVLALRQAAENYWSDVRYSSLEPVTMLWGTIVNGVRVAAGSDRATSAQKQVFNYPIEALVAFFHAVRDRMEVADHLYHAFKAMPAPECQAMAALLNVHVDARLEAATVCRLVRLLDHEGPMSADEHDDLASISNTNLVNAAFSGLRRHA